METETIVTRTAKIYQQEPGIVQVLVLPGAIQTLADAKENMQAQARLTAGQRHALFVDMRQIQSQDREAREYYAGPESAQILKAVAILIGSPMSRVIGNFMLGFNRSTLPTRLFTSEDEALSWLRSFK